MSLSVFIHSYYYHWNGNQNHLHFHFDQFIRFVFFSPIFVNIRLCCKQITFYIHVIIINCNRTYIPPLFKRKDFIFYGFMRDIFIESYFRFLDSFSSGPWFLDHCPPTYIVFSGISFLVEILKRVLIVMCAV